MKGKKTGGRKAGVPNKSTAEVRALAQSYAPFVIERLAQIAMSEDLKASVTACRELLDRGYGKAPQPIDGDGDGGPVKLEVSWLPPES